MQVTLVHVHVKPERVGDSSTRPAATTRARSASPGNVRFDVLQSEDDPARVVLVEMFRDAEAAAAHKKTPHYLAWREEVAGWDGVRRARGGGSGWSPRERDGVVRTRAPAAHRVRARRAPAAAGAGRRLRAPRPARDGCALAAGVGARALAPRVVPSPRARGARARRGGRAVARVRGRRGARAPRARHRRGGGHRGRQRARRGQGDRGAASERAQRDGPPRGSGPRRSVRGPGDADARGAHDRGHRQRGHAQRGAGRARARRVQAFVPPRRAGSAVGGGGSRPARNLPARS